MSVIDLNLKENQLTQSVMDCFFKVHTAMGPGLLESVYEECLCYEMTKRSMNFERQKEIPLYYDGIALKNNLRADLVVENKVVVEVKSIEKLLPIHDAQLLTYLRMTKCPIGFLANFNVPLIKDGVKRLVL